MKITYSITVCNESRELYSLIAFLKKVKDPGDDINVLLDTAHCNSNVRKVLKHFENDIIVNERDFDGNFSDHRNYHITTCVGEYIFMIDADEMPQEHLIKNIKNVIRDTNGDAFMVPRINIHPGYTSEWLQASKFHVNENGWINWPDYNCRIIKNAPDRIKFANSLHEMISGHKKLVSLRPTPDVAVWHIKSVEKQDSRWYNGDYIIPGDDNLYDNLL